MDCIFASLMLMMLIIGVQVGRMLERLGAKERKRASNDVAKPDDNDDRLAVWTAASGKVAHTNNTCRVGLTWVKTSCLAISKGVDKITFGVAPRTILMGIGSAMEAEDLESASEEPTVAAGSVSTSPDILNRVLAMGSDLKSAATSMQSDQQKNREEMTRDKASRPSPHGPAAAAGRRLEPGA